MVGPISTTSGSRFSVHTTAREGGHLRLYKTLHAREAPETAVSQIGGVT
jgi:hypothetical protein